MRDIEKRCDDESSRSCRCLIRPHVKFDCLIYDETGADSHADICRLATPRLTSSILSLPGLHGSPFQKAQNKPIFNTVYLKQTLDVRMSKNLKS